MPHQPPSYRHERIRHHLMAAWVAGWYAGRNGVRNDDGKRDYADQVAPLFERELDDAADTRVHLTPAGAALVRDLDRGMLLTGHPVGECCTCRLPEVAHVVGNAGHEYDEVPS